MSCEEVIEQLPDHAMGTLSETEDAAVRRHLRGCGSCRTAASELDQGLVMFSSAAHAIEPPPELRAKVLAVLGEEWEEAPPPARRPRVPFAWAVAAGIALLAGAIAWGALGQVRTGMLREDAASYRQFLHALGGVDVRVATLKGGGGADIEGAVVLYDSDKGQSWVLVNARAAGSTQPLTVTLSAPGGRSIVIPRRIQLSPDGEGETWLFTSANITRFRIVTLIDPAGTIVASATTGVGHSS